MKENSYLIALTPFNNQEGYTSLALEDLKLAQKATEDPLKRQSALFYILFDDFSNPYLLCDLKDMEQAHRELERRAITKFLGFYNDDVEVLIEKVRSGEVHREIQQKSLSLKFRLVKIGNRCRASAPVIAEAAGG